jgi:hypothetical protein
VQIDRWVDSFRLPIRMAVWLGALVVLMLLAFAAHSQDATLTWTHPTEYTDGTLIGPDGLGSTELRYGRCNTTRSDLLADPSPALVAVPFPAATHKIGNLISGEWCFQARSVTPAGTASEFTGFAWKLIDRTPKPPVLSSIITLAYETWRFFGKTYLGRNVGTIALGTACLEVPVVVTARATYFEIDPAALMPIVGRTPRSGPIVTQCDAG